MGISDEVGSHGEVGGNRGKRRGIICTCVYELCAARRNEVFEP